MKLCHAILIVFMFLTVIPTYGRQQDTLKVKTIEDAINITLEDFKKRIDNEDAIVYCIVKNQFNLKDVDFNEKYLLVENKINAKYIDRKTPKYLLTFHIAQEECGTVIDVSISSVEKKSRRKIEYTVQSFAIQTTYRIITH